MKRLLSVFILVAGSLVSFLPTAHASGCSSAVWGIVYPNQCILDYPDEATTVAGTNYRIPANLTACDQYFAGVVVNTGFDIVSYVRMSKTSTSGELKPGSMASVEVSVAEDCRAWTKAYLLSGSLNFANGVTVPVTLNEGLYKYRDKYTGSIDSYCFGNICGTATFSGNINIPNGASGAATFVLNINSNPTTQTGIQLTPISSQYNYTGYLFANGSTNPTQVPQTSPSASATPMVSPTPGATFDIATAPLISPTIQETKNGISCSLAYSQQGLSQYQITGTHWRITMGGNGTSSIIDEFDQPLGVHPNGDSIITKLNNGFSAAVLAKDGTLSYGYTVANQIVDKSYQCSTAINLKNGTGRYLSATYTATFSTANLILIPGTKKLNISKSLKCSNGRSTKLVKGTNPKCPSGYKVAK